MESVENVLVREVIESDLPEIGKLAMELIDSIENKEGLDFKEVVRNCKNLLEDCNSHILVAEVDGIVVGFINFTVRRTLLHSNPSGLIDELVVSREYRGKGIGRQLVGAAIERCKQLGCREVEVTTEFSNTKARRFYKSCGFEERGVILEKEL